MKPANDNKAPAGAVYTLDEAAALAEKLGIDVDYMLNYEVSIWNSNPKMAGLYVISCEDFIKIGVAGDPRKRLHQLQTCNPFPVSLEHFRMVGELGLALLAERTAHGVLADHAVGREWFRFDTAGAIQLVDIVSAIARETAIRSGRLYAKEAA